jgi:DNA-directed RNA polymerase subunit omega
MARITVEDCIEVVPSRFELVLLASQRARELNAGSRPSVEPEGEKTTVVSLREIAARSLDLDTLREKIVRGQQRISPPEEPPVDEGLEGTGLAAVIAAEAPLRYEEETDLDDGEMDEKGGDEADETAEFDER